MPTVDELLEGINQKLFNLDEIEIQVRHYGDGPYHATGTNLDQCSPSRVVDGSGSKYMSVGVAKMIADKERFCSKCFNLVKIHVPAARAINLSYVVDQLKKLSDWCTRLETADFSTTDGVLSYLHNYEMLSQKILFEDVDALPSSSTWKNAFTEMEARRLTQAISLLRGEHAQEFKGILASSLRIMDPVDKKLFPEYAAVLNAARRQLAQTLLDDSRLRILHFGNGWDLKKHRGKDPVLAVALTTLYPIPPDGFLVLPAPEAAFFDSEQAARTALLPEGLSTEEVRAALEAVKVLYTPDSLKGAYSNLQKALDAALAL